MPNYKKGFWVRVHFSAPSLEDADEVSLSALAIEQHAVGAPEGSPVEKVDIEVEWEHTSIFDDEGHEIERWTQEGKQEPDSSDPEFGNTYT